MAEEIVDLNAERQRRRGLADDGKCPGGYWRLLCAQLSAGGNPCPHVEPA